ncbi:MAG TPA: oligosaccharide flippase family protein [Vicinamibacterales bacterium]|nr:oligosaccharide flippase family protein [Acidobacteriota bacterium]HQX81319.1 oligosaccharide flippase family protein [Vicinamibacterales bacterium]
MTPEPSGPRDNAGLLNHAAQGVLGWAVPVMVTFVTTPLIVHGLGPDGFAVYAWAAAFTAGIATAGPARGVLHLVSRSAVARLRQEAVAAGLWSAVALGVVAAAVLWVLAPAAASAAQLPAWPALSALRIAVLGAIPAAVIAVCIGAFQGLRRFGIASALTSVAAIVTATGAAWIATHGSGVVAMVSWQAAASLAISVVSLLMLRRVVGPVWNAPTRTAASRVAGFGLATFCTQLAFAAWVIIERTLVGRYLGAEVLTALVIGLLLWMHATAALGSAVQVVASLAPAAGSVDDRLVRAYPSATIMTAVAAIASAALIAGLGVPALTLWIGADIATVAEPLLLPLAVGVGLNGLGTAAWFANEAEGRPARNAIWAATGLVLTSVTLLYLAPQGLIASGGIARLVAVAPGPLFIVWTEWASGGRLRAPWLRILACVLPCGVLLFAGLRTVAVAAASSWLVLISAAAVGMALYAAAVWFLPVLTHRDRQALRTWLKSRV